MCLVINLFAGPGSGKSTTCAGIFSRLKLNNINCEMALEYAKEKVWENSLEILDDQIYVFAQQLHRLNILKNKVDVIITDSPLLLSMIYNKEPNNIFSELVFNQFDKFENVNYYIERDENFNPKGRVQNLEQSIDKDNEIKILLDNNHVPYDIVNKINAVDKITEDILKRLNKNEDN
jgi:adenylate kinase family enzyme